MSNKKQAKLPFVKGQYGENWRRLRESTGKTVREFAKIIQFSYPVISKIENELAVPTIEQLITYQEMFGVSFDYLIGLTATKDVDIKLVTKLTGISEDAIAVLTKAREDYSVFDEFIVNHLQATFNDLMKLYRRSAELDTDDYGYDDLIDTVRFKAIRNYDKVLDCFDCRNLNQQKAKKKSGQSKMMKSYVSSCPEK